MSKMSFEDFKSMIEISPINTNLIEYKDKNNKLIAVMLFDTQKDGLSAVYSFYKPEYKKNSIGNLYDITFNRNDKINET